MVPLEWINILLTGALRLRRLHCAGLGRVSRKYHIYHNHGIA